MQVRDEGEDRRAAGSRCRSRPRSRSADSFRPRRSGRPHPGGALSLPTQPPEGDEVTRSIPTTFDRPLPMRPGRYTIGERLERSLDRVSPQMIGLFFVVVALGVYYFSDPARTGFYNHFVWQADAFLHGRFAISYPVVDGQYTNGYFQDVLPLPSDPGEFSYALLPFPPLPAILLMPFAAVFGLATNSQLFGVVLGAVNVGLAFRMTTRLTDRRAVSVLATIFFSFGTVYWYAAMLSTTWFLAHVVATTFSLLGITLALDGERRERAAAALRALKSTAAGPNRFAAAIDGRSMFLAAYRRARPHFAPVQFMAGLVFGIAALARLTVIFAAPFFLFVGPGGSIFKRGASAALGAIVPVALLLVYNMLSSGHIFNPAYDFLYHNEYLGYMPPGLEIDTSYGIEDIRHIPLNLLIMFGWPPDYAPMGTDCGLGWLNPDCPVLRPSQIGMSILLTSPAYLLAVPLVIRHWRERVVMGATLAVLSIAFVNLMHFSQGWVQFGYRFSNDFAPFALVLVTLAIARYGVRLLTVGLVAASVLINAWGVYWGVTLGW